MHPPSILPWSRPGAAGSPESHPGGFAELDGGRCPPRSSTAHKRGPFAYFELPKSPLLKIDVGIFIFVKLKYFLLAKSSKVPTLLGHDFLT